MQNKKTFIVALVAILIIAIGGYAFPRIPEVAGKFGTILDTFTGDYFNVVTANGGGAYQINGVSIINTSTTTLGSQNVPYYYTLGNVKYADVEQTFTSATNTPVIIRNPFGAATSTFGWNGIQVQITQGGPQIEFDIATTTVTTNATTTAVLVKDILVANNGNYDGTFYPNTATSTATGSNAPVAVGTLPGFSNTPNHFGESTWFLKPSEAIMLKIASTSVSGSLTGTVSVTFKKP